jgi:hypothetical protein
MKGINWILAWAVVLGCLFSSMSCTMWILMLRGVDLNLWFAFASTVFTAFYWFIFGRIDFSK